MVTTAVREITSTEGAGQGDKYDSGRVHRTLQSGFTTPYKDEIRTFRPLLASDTNPLPQAFFASFHPVMRES
jgi:hypothetical protein